MLRPMVARKGIVVSARIARIRGDEIKNMLVSPHSGERLRNIEVAEADFFECRDVELEIIAGSEFDAFAIVEGLENEFLDEGGNTAIADHSQAECALCAGSATAGARHVDLDSACALSDWIGGETTADRRSGRRSVRQVEAPVVLGAFNHVLDDEAVGEVSVAVRADSVRGV